MSSTSWWKDPGFLQHDLEQWPDLVTNYEVKVLMQSLSRTCQWSSNTSGQGDTRTINLDQIIFVKHFSMRLKLLRVTSLVLKFKELLEMPENISGRRVTTEDISMAERLWTKTIQLQSFPNECQDLAKKKKEGSLKQLILSSTEITKECCTTRGDLVQHLFQHLLMIQFCFHQSIHTLSC